MLALTVSDVSLAFGAETILSHISFAVNDGDHVGIIGVNGAGKTSLFRIITGQYEPVSGAVYIQKGHTVGLLEQNPDLSLLPPKTTCLEYMYTAFPHLLALEAELRRDEEALDTLSRSGKHEATIALAAALAEKNRRFAAEGGLEFRSRARGMLLRLGFAEGQLEQRIETLSGGQYTRLELARLLATEPDILMLDEPTNHLDLDAVNWLESYLTSYKKTVLIISHDRYFLDKITNKTLHILYTRAKLYPAPYSAARAMQEAEEDSLERRYREQQKEIARIRKNIEFQRRCNREHNFVTIRSKEKQLARMEKIELAPPPPREIRLSFAAEEQSAGDVLTVRDLSFSYGGAPLLCGLSFLVRRYERVLLLGRNGCGKSTIMKLINGMLTPTAGKITLGYNIKIGYYDQENRGLCADKTVLEELHDAYPDRKDGELRSVLALFLFGEEDVQQPIRTLSGGERARLTLAKLMLKKVNLLVMDEPTNHLDIGSAEALETALLAFDGTVIAVSHDRYFINRIATRIIEIDNTHPGGMIDYPLEDYDDAYETYLSLRERTRATPTVTAPAPPSGSKADYEQKKRENAERRGAERRLERARVRIAELEEETEALDRELFGPAASDYVRAAEIDARKAEIEEELLSLYELVL